VQKAVERATAAGVIVLAAAGNDVGFVVWPARYEAVIAVAACNIEKRPWRGSSRGCGRRHHGAGGERMARAL
jgi:serine protease